MTDTTNLGEIVVTGQRRRNSSYAFPSPGGSGGGGGTGYDVPLTVSEDPNPPPPAEFNPCGNATSRKIWNADARAAAAVADLFAKAASLNDGSNLSNREFGANLFADDAGNVCLTAVTPGQTPTPGDFPEVTIEPGGTTYWNWMGDIHNHPSGDGRLNFNEYSRFEARIRSIRELHPQRLEMAFVAAYVVVLDSTVPLGYRIYAHRAGSGANYPGEEVNPEGQPCPNA